MTILDQFTPQLVDLQSAVEEIHALYFDGEAAAAAAIATGMTGPVSTVPPEAMEILAAALSGPYSATYSGIWDGDYGNPEDEHGPKGDASLADWILANELAYQALRHKIADETLGEIIEQLMRASGAYRPKYDRPWTVKIDGETIHTSYLGVTIGKAIKRQQKRRDDYRAKHPDITVTWTENGAGVAEELDESEPVPLVETVEQELTRLRRENANLRAVKAVQMTVIRDLQDRLNGWKAVLSNPNLKNFADRIVALPMIEDMKAAQALGQDEVHIRFPGIVNGWGIPESTVAKSAAVLTEMVGAPAEKRIDRSETIQLATGEIVTPKKAIVRPVVTEDLYSAYATYDPGLPKRGGKRLPECKDHPGADVIIRSVKTCATCRKPIEPAKQQTLYRQNEGIGGGASAPVLDTGTSYLQNDGIGGHDGEEQSRAAAMVGTKLIRPDVDAWKQPTFPDLDPLRPTDDGDAENPPDWLDEWPDEGGSLSAVTCTRCSEPVVPGHKLYCAVHVADADQVVMPWERPAAVAGAEE